MKVKIKKLHPSAVIPKYSKKGDAGLDLTAVEVKNLGDQIKCDTGLSIEIPEGYVGLLFPRSSIFQYDLSLANSVGVIDSGFRGEVSCLFNVKRVEGSDSVRYKAGDRVAQLLIVPYPEIEFEEVGELETSERGEGGFGSTGQ